MNTIGVNNTENNSFAKSAEELLTRCAPDMHTLFTELLTSAAAQLQRTKRASTKGRIAQECATLQAALSEGWRAGILQLPQPNLIDERCAWSERITALIRPYCARGYHMGQCRVDELMRRGHHVSQRKDAPGRITIPDPPHPRPGAGTAPS